MQPSLDILQATDVDFISEIDASETNYDLFRVLRMMCAEYGCERFIVCEVPKHDEFNLQEQLIVSNWDPELIREFENTYRELFEKLMESMRKAMLPLHEELPIEIDEAKSAPLHKQGMCIFFPVFDHCGRKGMVGFSVTGSEIGQRLANLSLLCGYLFNRFMQIKNETSPKYSALTDREIKCLNWTALGKTSYEIGIILNISLNTVNHYLNNASRKLNCVNKTHAVAKCVQDGII